MQTDSIKLFFESQKDIYSRIDHEGVIMSIGDGIVKACGLRSVTAGEMVVMGCKSVKGMALNLEHDRVGIVVFGNDRDLKAGDFIVRSFSIMELGLSMKLFGRIIDGLGNDLSDETSSYLSDIKK